MKGLTDKQQNVLDYIQRFSQRENMPPTIYEISSHFGVKPATVCAHIKALQQKGYVSRSSKARSLTLSSKNSTPRHFSMTMSIPLLGRVNAGAPLFSEENIESHINLDPSWLPHGLRQRDLFALQVQGESMRDLGILDGDLLIAHRTADVTVGNVVIAMIDGETTVKSLYLTDGQWELRPANPEFKSKMVPLDSLAVQGVVVGLLRSFGLSFSHR